MKKTHPSPGVMISVGNGLCNCPNNLYTTELEECLGVLRRDISTGIGMQHWRKSSIENMGPEKLESRGLKRLGWFRKKVMNTPFGSKSSCEDII